MGKLVFGLIGSTIVAFTMAAVSLLSVEPYFILISAFLGLVGAFLAGVFWLSLLAHRRDAQQSRRKDICGKCNGRMKPGLIPGYHCAACGRAQAS